MNRCGPGHPVRSPSFAMRCNFVKLPFRRIWKLSGIGLVVLSAIGGGAFLAMFPWALETTAIEGVEGPKIPLITFASANGDIGAMAYGRACGYCHDTNIAPNLRGRELDPEAVKYFARHGSRAMPAFRNTDISDAELNAIAALIAANKLPEQSR